MYILQTYQSDKKQKAFFGFKHPMLNDVQYF